MIFTETPLSGAFTIDPEPMEDERGAFARIWCRREFDARGLQTRLEQCSISFNKRAGTLRGMHYQIPPYEEVKLVRCTQGAIFDAIIDLRPTSPTFGEYYSAVLSASNRRTLYVPCGFAHGFQTLENDSEIVYCISEAYQPDFSRGVRWDDPAFGIQWPPADTRIMTDRDRTYSDFVAQTRPTHAPSHV